MSCAARVLPLILWLALAIAPRPASAVENYTLCGGSPGGLWSLLGVGLDAAVKAADPDTTITYQTSSGGYANVLQLTEGNCDLALASVGEVLPAVSGTDPFKAPVEGLAVLMVLFDWSPMHWVASKDFAAKYGISSLEDIAAKKPPMRLILNRRGILMSRTAEQALNAVGVTLADIEAWGGTIDRHASQDAIVMMQDRRADVWANGMFIGSAAIVNIGEALPITLLQMPDAAIRSVAEIYGEKPMEIPAGAYPWLEETISAHSAKSVLIVRDTMDEETAYRITKAVLENIDQVRGVHKEMQALSPEVMASLSELPYHTGATRAYGEAGLR